MPYTPTDWKDRAVEKPGTYSIANNPDGTVTLASAEGTVYEDGTPLSASNLNNMEAGIQGAFDAVEKISPLGASVWNAAKFGDWTLTGGLSVAGDGLALGGATGQVDNNTYALGNSFAANASKGYGIKVTTGVKGVRLNKVLLKNSLSTITLKILNASDGIILYNANAMSGTSPSWVDLSGANIIFQPNESYWIEVVGNQDFTTYDGTFASSFPKTGFVVNGGYTNRDSIPTIDTGFVFAVAGIEVEEYVVGLSANALSPTIPRDTVAHWNKLSAMFDAPAGSSILFDIEKTDGTKLLTDLTDGADLSALPLYDVKVRAKFTRTDTSIQPVLKSVMVDWAGVNAEAGRKTVRGSYTSAGGNSAYVTALDITGAGKLLALMIDSDGAKYRITVDGAVISWGGGASGSNIVPGPLWLYSASESAQAYTTTGNQANCQVSFKKSLKIEVSMASIGAGYFRTINYVYEIS